MIFKILLGISSVIHIHFKNLLIKKLINHFKNQLINQLNDHTVVGWKF